MHFCEKLANEQPFDIWILCLDDVNTMEKREKREAARMCSKTNSWCRVLYQLFALWPTTYIQQLISHNLYTTTNIQQLISHNLYPTTFIPTTNIPLLISYNLYPKTYIPQFISHNLYPTIHIPQLISHRSPLAQRIRSDLKIVNVRLSLLKRRYSGVKSPQ